MPQIEVTFAIDSNGIVNVSARDMATNQSQSDPDQPRRAACRRTRSTAWSRRPTPTPTPTASGARCASCKNRLEGLIYTNERVFDQFRA